MTQFRRIFPDGGATLYQEGLILTGLISSMIHSASKQLKHVKAIFLSEGQNHTRTGATRPGAGGRPRAFLTRWDGHLGGLLTSVDQVLGDQEQVSWMGRFYSSVQMLTAC